MSSQLSSPALPESSKHHNIFRVKCLIVLSPEFLSLVYGRKGERGACPRVSWSINKILTVVGLSLYMSINRTQNSTTEFFTDSNCCTFLVVCFHENAVKQLLLELHF